MSVIPHDLQDATGRERHFRSSHSRPIAKGTSNREIHPSRINSFQPPAGKIDHDEIDEAMPGFGVRFRNGGTGTFFIKFKIGNKHGRLSLGKVGKVTLADAQAAASEHFAAIADKKIDPSVERARTAAKASDSIGPLIDDFMRYLATKEAQWREAITVLLRENERTLRPICKATAPLPPPTSTAPWSQRYWRRSGRSAARLLPTAAARIYRQFFSWAIAEGHTEENPVAGTTKTGSKARDRVLQDSEIAAIWKALGDDDYGDIVRLLILTGARRDEIGSLRRGEINFAQKQIELPGSRTKGGDRSRHPTGSARAVDLEGARTARGQRLRFRAREGRLRRLGQVQGAARCAARS